jgi:hypothetical protein
MKRAGQAERRAPRNKPKPQNPATNEAANRTFRDAFQRHTTKNAPHGCSILAAPRSRRANRGTPFPFPRRCPRAIRLRLASPNPSGHPRAVQGNRTPASGAGTLHSRAPKPRSNSSLMPHFWRQGNGTSRRRASVGGTPGTQLQQAPIAQVIFPLAGPLARRTKGTPPPKRRCSMLALARS